MNLLTITSIEADSVIIKLNAGFVNGTTQDDTGIRIKCYLISNPTVACEKHKMIKLCLT